MTTTVSVFSVSVGDKTVRIFGSMDDCFRNMQEQSQREHFRLYGVVGRSSCQYGDCVQVEQKMQLGGFDHEPKAVGKRADMCPSAETLRLTG